jgi:aspartate kinase
MSKIFVFKFGGASVKDAASIQNLRNILHNRLRNPTVIVVSAMGKTTNALEEILGLKLAGEDFSLKSTTLKNYHLGICAGLFDKEHRVFSVVENYFSQLERFLHKKLSKENYDEYYDQVVSFGELISSRIVQEYLCESGIFCVWQDATGSGHDQSRLSICEDPLGKDCPTLPKDTQADLGTIPNCDTGIYRK